MRERSEIRRAQARWAVGVWADFPVDQVPRALVLADTEVQVQKGFRTGEAKNAFGEGWFVVAYTLQGITHRLTAWLDAPLGARVFVGLHGRHRPEPGSALSPEDSFAQARFAGGIVEPT